MVKLVPAFNLNVREPGEFPPVDGTVICWSGTFGIPGLNTPTRYVPGTTLRVNEPSVPDWPPVPNPTDEPPDVVLETGRAKTPAPLTPVPPESRTKPAMVLEVADSTKFLPVMDVGVAVTVMLGGGMNVNVGGGGGGAPGARNVEGMEGPTPTW